MHRLQLASACLTVCCIGHLQVRVIFICCQRSSVLVSSPLWQQSRLCYSAPSVVLGPRAFIDILLTLPYATAISLFAAMTSLLLWHHCICIVRFTQHCICADVTCSFNSTRHHGTGVILTHQFPRSLLFRNQHSLPVPICC